MTTWTDEDQQRLEELEQRKAQFWAERREGVECAIETFYYSGMPSSDLVRNLTANADEVIAALTPFCGGKHGR